MDDEADRVDEALIRLGESLTKVEESDLCQFCKGLTPKPSALFLLFLPLKETRRDP